VASFGVLVFQQGLFATSRASGPLRLPAVLAGLASFVFFAGFYGVERVWYAALLSGQRMRWSEVRRLNGDLRSRYIRLGLLLMPFLLVIGAVSDVSNPLLRYGLGGGVAVVMDVTLTFVTVELTFATASATEAFRSGVALLREQWPRCAMYALVPPFGIQLIGQLGAGGSATTGRIVGIVAVAPLAIACRGATVRYYVRECQPSPAAP
jgi:hypothetical protein